MKKWQITRIDRAGKEHPISLHADILSTHDAMKIFEAVYKEKAVLDKGGFIALLRKETTMTNETTMIAYEDETGYHEDLAFVIDDNTYQSIRTEQVLTKDMIIADEL